SWFRPTRSRRSSGCQCRKLEDSATTNLCGPGTMRCSWSPTRCTPCCLPIAISLHWKLHSFRGAGAGAVAASEVEGAVLAAPFFRNHEVHNNQHEKEREYSDD